MATAAESYSVRRGEEKAPISAHPAFPAIVALWFAALLGLGSLVLPVALLERLAALTGIAALVPAAEAPLGSTARAAIALTGAIAGALVGLLLARQVARSQAQSAARGEVLEWRPISAHDELGDEGLESLDPAPASSRRRYLFAPEPDGEAEVAEENRQAGEDAPQGFETGDSAEDHTPIQDQAMIEGPDFDSAAQIGQDRCEREEARSFPAPTEDIRNPPAHQLSVVLPGGHDDVSFTPAADDRPLEELGLVQLAARLGASIEKRRALRAAAPVAAPAAPRSDGPADLEAAEAEDAARARADFFGPGEAPAPGWRAPAGFEAEPLRPAVPSSMRALQIEDEDDGFEEDDDDTLPASFSLPLDHQPSGHGLSGGEITGEDDSLDEDEADDGDYSSLLAMKNPFSRHEEFVRTGEPGPEDGYFEPMAAFPAASPAATDETPAAPLQEQAFADPGRPIESSEESTVSAALADASSAPQDADEAERDLRAALATLQRLSGGA